MAEASASSTGPSNLPNYFKNLAQVYPRQTGNSTLNLFAQLTDRLAPISSTSVVHDNASGPGTATSVIMKDIQPDAHPTIVATDMVPAMIEAFNSTVSETSTWNQERITGVVMKSENLNFPDAHFTHSITNFSIFNFADPLSSVKEIYRTLQPSGQALITTWKLFGIGEVVHETQRRIRPDLPEMKYSGKELYDADAVVDIMLHAGFVRHQIHVLSMTQIVSGEDLEGLRGFANGPFTDSARTGWTDEEKGRWQEVVHEVLEEEKTKYRGVKFEGWAILATK
jgi:ubiquinone/menaquinone biosynthesis C-methylase UbiE